MLELAAMEVEHEKLFSAMRAELGDEAKGSTIFDPEGETCGCCTRRSGLRKGSRVPG